MIQTSPAYFTTFKQFKEIFQKEKKNIILKKERHYRGNWQIIKTSSKPKLIWQGKTPFHIIIIIKLTKTSDLSITSTQNKSILQAKQNSHWSLLLLIEKRKNQVIIDGETEDCRDMVGRFRGRIGDLDGAHVEGRGGKTIKHVA